MYFAPILILCSLLQAGSEGTMPGGRLVDPSQLPPATSVTPVAPVVPVAPETPVPTAVQTPPTVNANQVHDSNGYVDVPRRNRVPVPATVQALLESLKIEQRDALGNILRDSEGNPVMVPIREGMNVVKGQVLGNFDDRVLRGTLKINQAQLDVAKSERDKEIEKVVAARGVQVAWAELESMLEANRKHSGTVSAVDVERAKLALEHAKANLELQIYTIDEIKTREVIVREAELEQTELQIELRKLVAPIGGMIVKVHAAEGEWKREGDPIVEILQLDIVWVRIEVNANRYTASDLDGKRAMIRARLPNGSVETFQGMVVFCDPTILAAGGSFYVYIEVQNRRIGNYWLLQPGRDGLDVVIAL